MTIDIVIQFKAVARSVGNEFPQMQHLNLAEILKHRVNHFKSLVDFFSNLGTSQDNLAGDKDENPALHDKRYSTIHRKAY